MSYQVLARKWRPRNFQEMVGQEHVLRMLTNALDNQRLHHAYLFTGTRGVGKTTLGRILAKCLNCESGITSKPCGTCSTCVAIDTGRFLDLIEVDAASRTKVEDTRELLDNVQYSPTQGRFKIYLIDEVHMLSGHSFNALLKTLEEPPAHVKFLLATTDPKKLPVTILSRCLQFHLKRVPPEQISQHLQNICDQEKITYTTEALAELATAADGSLRDALSLLDQAIAYCNGNIVTEDMHRMLGNVERDTIFRLLTALQEQDAAKVFAEITELTEVAPDFDHVLESLLHCLHQIAVAQALGHTPVNTAEAALVLRLSPEDVQLYYQIALIGRRDLPLAASPVQGFEMILLRMLAFHPAATPSVTTPAPKKNLTPPPTPKTTIAAQHTAASPVTSKSWLDILPQLDLSGMTQTLASHCALEQLTEDSLQLVLTKKHEAFLSANARTRLEEALTNYYQRNIKLQIRITPEEFHTSAKQQAMDHTQRHAGAVAAIQTDHHIQKILDVFDATLDMDSIKAID